MPAKFTIVGGPYEPDPEWLVDFIVTMALKKAERLIKEACATGNSEGDKASGTPVPHPLQESALRKASQKVGMPLKTVRAAKKVDASSDTGLIKAIESKIVRTNRGGNS